MPVVIPSVNRREERIGSIFNDLFKIIFESEKYVGFPEWDFTNVSFFHPFFHAAFSIYKDTCVPNAVITGIPVRIRNYFDITHFESPLELGYGSDAINTLARYSDKSFIPVCKFGLKGNDIDQLQTYIQRTIESQKTLMPNMKETLSYILGELICNMQEHSCGNFGYVFSQYINDEMFLCLADDGISIYSSYIRSRKYLDKINTEAEALKMAVEGYSTKDLPEAENRGYGLSTNIDILVNGLGGSFFILSGSSFYRHEKGDERFVNLPKVINWGGTIILLKIPINAPQEYRLINYVGGY